MVRRLPTALHQGGNHGCESLLGMPRSAQGRCSHSRGAGDAASARTHACGLGQLSGRRLGPATWTRRSRTASRCVRRSAAPEGTPETRGGRSSRRGASQVGGRAGPHTRRLCAGISRTRLVAWRAAPGGRRHWERRRPLARRLPHFAARASAASPLQKLIKEGGSRRAWLDGLSRRPRAARAAPRGGADGRQTAPREVLGDATRRRYRPCGRARASPASWWCRAGRREPHRFNRTADGGHGDHLQGRQARPPRQGAAGGGENFSRNILPAAVRTWAGAPRLWRACVCGRRHGTTDIMADYEREKPGRRRLDERMRRLARGSAHADRAGHPRSHLAWCLRSLRNDAAVLAQ